MYLLIIIIIAKSIYILRDILNIIREKGRISKMNRATFQKSYIFRLKYRFEVKGENPYRRMQFEKVPVM